MTTKSRAQDSSNSKILSAGDLERFYERHELVSKNKVLATRLWKALVKNLGERQAKETMREIMGDKVPGPRRSDEDKVLIEFIRDYIRGCGPNLSDEKIAKRILESTLELDVDTSVASKKGVEIQTRQMRIDKGLAALEKHVGRIRREMIEECSLPKEYAPRPYRRD